MNRLQSELQPASLAEEPSDPRGRPRPFMGLPTGSRDLLPPASRARRALTQTLLEVFEAWGFSQAMTPLLEYYDVLARGLSTAGRRRCVRFIEPRGGAVVALRSDFTPQIARMVGQLGSSRDRTMRVSYADELVRLPVGDEREKAEQHQAGVELIGDASPGADAELIALCHDALRRCGLPEVRFDLSHRAVMASVLELVPDPVRAEVEALVVRKDRLGVARLASGVDGEGRVAIETAAELCDLYGRPEVLERVPSMLAGNPGIERLRSVLEHLRLLDDDLHARTDVDLGEVRGHDYYSGLRMRVWAPGESRPVVKGGRYDDLIGRYGAPAPAIGFAIDLDALEHALARSKAVVGQPPATHLVALAPGAGAPSRVTALRLAADARTDGRRAWVEPELSLEAARRHAANIGAMRLTFVDADGRTQDIAEPFATSGSSDEERR